MAYSSEEKAEAFADSLEEQFQLHNNPEDDIDREEEIERDARRILRLIPENPFPPIPPTTPVEIKNQIKMSNNKKAPGLDQIKNRTLKDLPDNIINSLTDIINASFNLNTFPKPWKTAVITLIPKKDQNLTFPQNWRPISLISSVAKIAEKIFLSRLLDILQEQNIIPDEQFGFRTSHSTEHQLVRLVDSISVGLQRKSSTGLIALDIQKAFDKVWHLGLIYKMHHTFQINLNFIKFIGSYLRNRKFFAKAYQSLSQIRNIEAGVPQGSPIAPILYNIFTADIPKTPHTSLSIYADDTAIYATDRSQRRLKIHLQRQTDEIQNWMTLWKIKANPEKTQAILFTNKRRQPEPVTIEDRQIVWGNTLKYLGITFDKRLTWKQHITDKTRKTKRLYSKLYPLLNRRSKLNLKNKTLLYKQTIRPVMLYGSNAWCHTSMSNKKLFQTCQNKILRHITNAPWYIRGTDIHKDLKTERIDEFIDKRHRTFYAKLPDMPNPIFQNNFPINPNPDFNITRYRNVNAPVIVHPQ